VATSPQQPRTTPGAVAELDAGRVGGAGERARGRTGEWALHPADGLRFPIHGARYRRSRNAAERICRLLGRGSLVCPNAASPAPRFTGVEGFRRYRLPNGRERLMGLRRAVRSHPITTTRRRLALPPAALPQRDLLGPCRAWVPGRASNRARDPHSTDRAPTVRRSRPGRLFAKPLGQLPVLGPTRSGRDVFLPPRALPTAFEPGWIAAIVVIAFGLAHRRVDRIGPQDPSGGLDRRPSLMRITGPVSLRLSQARSSAICGSWPHSARRSTTRLIAVMIVWWPFY